MTREEFKKITDEYVGTIRESDDEITFSNNNNLNGKKVYCEISLTDDNSLNGYEKTYEILGGFGFPDTCAGELRMELERYCFVKKQHGYRQLSLFECL